MPPQFPVRPIGARPLKSAMDTLRPHLAGANVLDLFAGQGRLGLGALREGADSAVFVEIVPALGREIQKQAMKFRYNADVIVSDVREYLAREDFASPFDVVFADPPFPLWGRDFSDWLFSRVSVHIKLGGIFLVKHPVGMLPWLPLSEFTLWKSSDFGESSLLYYRYGKE